MRKKAIICAVERGWQNTRQMSLELARKGYIVGILIKGAVKPDVLAMITAYAGIKISAVRRFCFGPILFFRITLYAIFLRLKAVVVEAKDIDKWIFFLSRVFSLKVFSVEDEGGIWD